MAGVAQTLQRRRRVPEDTSQLVFAGIFHAQHQGDGTYRLIPKSTPAAELTPKEFGIALGGVAHPVSRSTIYRWMEDGTIRRGEWRKVGLLKILIQASAIERLKEKFEEI